MSLVIPLARPCTSTIAIQVPNRSHAARCWLGHMTNYYWAYYQKSALARGSGWGGRRRRRVTTGIPIKPAEHPRTKGEGQIPPAADKQKEFISITNGCCLRWCWLKGGAGGSQKVTRSYSVCVCVFVYLFVQQRALSAFLFIYGPKEGRRAEC